MQNNVIGVRVHFGDRVQLGFFNVICDDVVLGDGTIVGNFCELASGLVTGKRVVLQGRVRTSDDCVIEDDVVIKYGTILTKNVLVKAGAFIGPNVITLGADHHRKPGYGTVIGGGKTFIGAGTKIAANIKICDDVISGAMTFVNRDITEPGVYVGVPARKIR